MASLVDDYEDEGGIPPPPGGAPPPAPGGVPGPAVGLQQTAAAGGGGGGGNRGPDLGPQYNFPGLPGFVPPQFVAPTLEMAQAEPGYQFRLQSGQNALERSAAARGVLRSGGTLRDLTEYGQKFGQQEFANVYNRALSAFDRRYQGEKDRYAPQLARWQTMANAEVQRALALYGRQGRGGGGGGGGGMPPLDVILEPPPQMPEYAQTMGLGPASFAPASGVGGGEGGGGYGEDEDRFRY